MRVFLLSLTLCAALFTCVMADDTQVQGQPLTAILRTAINATEAGDFSTSVSITTRVLDSGAVPESERHLFYYQRGYSYLMMEQYRLAVDDLSAAINGLRRSPYSSSEGLSYPYRYRGQAYAMLGKSDDAIADFTFVLGVHPNDAVILYQRGLAHYSKRDTDKAIADFTAAINSKPDFAEAYANRGENFQNLKQFEKAIADYDAAVRIRPDYEMAFNDRGSAEAALKKYGEALADLNKAIELNPSDPYAWDNRGWLSLDKRDFQSAIADFQKGLSLTKDSAVTADIQEGLDKARSQLTPASH